MSIKKFLLFSLLSFAFSIPLFSQILEPVKWDAKVEKISDTEFDLIFTAHIDKGWYIYSQNKIEEDGFAPQTLFFFES
jgi:thiol:disulfide interchange protein DsbD